MLNLTPSSAACPRQRARGCLFHGTSTKALDEIAAGTNTIRPVYTEANVSLGGVYLTGRHDIAEIAARRAARSHRADPVILIVRTLYPLLPDEDWVVPAAERSSRRIFDWRTESYRDPRLEGFFANLFSTYEGEGFSLSDAYAERYDELNDDYDITWRDSYRLIQSVRQDHVLSVDQVAQVFLLGD